MRKLNVLIVAMAAILLVGCTAMPKRGEFVKGTPPQMVADESHGVVTFLRESKFVAGGVSYYITEDGNTIGALRSGTWFKHKATVGQHTYIAGDIPSSTLTLTVEPGKYYYIIGTIAWTLPNGRPSLAVSSEPHAQELIKKLTYLKKS